MYGKKNKLFFVAFLETDQKFEFTYGNGFCY